MYVLLTILALVRLVVMVLAVVMMAAFVLDWLVRTRRISPFSAVARFTRRAIDPLLAPIERSVARAGGNPASAPWWGLVAVVVGGILLITVLESFFGMLVGLGAAASAGPAGLAVGLLRLTFQLLEFALLVRVFSSWLPVSPYSPWIRWSYALTEWMLAPLRSFVPSLGGLDLTPLIAFYVIRLVGGFVVDAVARQVG